MTIIPYISSFAKDPSLLNKDNLIPSKNTISSKQFLEHWNEFSKIYK